MEELNPIMFQSDRLKKSSSKMFDVWVIQYFSYRCVLKASINDQR